MTADGYRGDNNTAYEFNGCNYHGCPCCSVGDDEATVKYVKT
jgi:hypothetical protein